MKQERRCTKYKTFLFRKNKDLKKKEDERKKEKRTKQMNRVKYKDFKLYDYSCSFNFI